MSRHHSVSVSLGCCGEGEAIKRSYIKPVCTFTYMY